MNEKQEIYDKCVSILARLDSILDITKDIKGKLE